MATTVFGVETYPNGATPVVGALVLLRRVVSLTSSSAAGYDAGDQVAIIGESQLVTDATGRWEADVEPTDDPDIAPANSWFRAEVAAPGHPKIVHTFEVPAAASSPMWIGLNLVDGPTALPSSPLSAHLADASDAHDAAAISYDNTTSGLTAAELQAAVDELEARLDSLEAIHAGDTFLVIE